MRRQKQITSERAGGQAARRGLHLSGMAWLYVGLATIFALGAGLSLFLRHDRNVRPVNTTISRRSLLGVDRFQSTNEGVTFDAVEPPDGPADKAGLVGGDIIKSFDAQPVTTPEGLMDLLDRTPAGKTVEVGYLRDGEFHKTKLTMISEDDFNRLRNSGDRPQGMFGIDPDRTTQIRVPETKTYGVKLGYVRPNGPADLFGIKEGDIITDFDKVPIRTSRELTSRVLRATPRSTVEVVVVRDGQTRTIPVTIGQSR